MSISQQQALELVEAYNKRSSCQSKISRLKASDIGDRIQVKIDGRYENMFFDIIVAETIKRAIMDEYIRKLTIINNKIISLGGEIKC